MIKIVKILAVIILLLGLQPKAIFAQTGESSISEIYQKPDPNLWGDIFHWVFKKRYFEKSYALVIGVGDYKEWPKLEAPYYDAIRVRDFLINDAGYDYVVTLINSEATKQKINILMEDTFPKLINKNDRFLFYYSGHGTQRMIGDIPFGYLPLQNSEQESYSNMISMDGIRRWDRLLYPTRHVLFILDCCFSGLAGYQAKSHLTDKKLERLSQYAHNLITAGTSDEISVSCLNKWGGSLFTDSFLKGASGKADLESGDSGADGIVSLKELMIYIEDRIDAESTKQENQNLFSKSIKLSPQVFDLQMSEGEFFFISKYTKNLKVGNDKENDLNKGWPFDANMKINFASESPLILSDHDIKSMLKGKGLFDSKWNRSAKGFGNKFELTKINGDKVIIDHASGLMWQQAGSSNEMTLQESKLWLKELNYKGYAGFHDWRLPTLIEAKSLVEPKQNKAGLYISDNFDSDQSWIWTSNLGESKAWYVSFSFGNCGCVNIFNNIYACAVRVNNYENFKKNLLSLSIEQLED